MRSQQVAAAALVVCFTLSSSVPVYALEGFTVEHGSVTADPQEGSDTHLHIESDQAILAFREFNIGPSETVDFHFHNPSAAGSILNRVTGGEISSIAGRLLSNGQVILINPAGINIADTARIDTAGFIASTLNISNADFLQGHLIFEQEPGLSPALVRNAGSIRVVTPGRLAALLGGSVDNSGSMVAELGTVALVSGRTATLSLDQNGWLAVAVTDPLSQVAIGFEGKPVADAIAQTGTISASGGQVLIHAKVLPGLFDRLITMPKGVVEAVSTVNRNGRVELIGEGGPVYLAGAIRADGREAGSTGGTVHLLGERVGLLGDARMDVSGASGGGTILIGGDFHGKGTLPNAIRTYVSPGARITADALIKGNGGKVVVWSDDFTGYYGAISTRGGAQGGDGGFAEVSGKNSLIFEGTADLDAVHGKSGTLLLDPLDITILMSPLLSLGNNSELNDREILFGDGPSNAAWTITSGKLETLTSNVLLQARRDISIRTRFSATPTINFSQLTAGKSVTFQAGRHILFPASFGVNIAGGDLYLEADSPHRPTGGADGVGTLQLGQLTSNGGKISLIGADFDLSHPNTLVNAGSGDIDVALSRNNATLLLGSVPGAPLTDAELDRLLTTGTLKLGQAVTRGPAGDGVGSLVRTAGTVLLDGLTQGSKNIQIVSAGSIDDPDDIGTAIATTGTLTLSAGGAIGSLNGAAGLNTDVSILQTRPPMGIAVSSSPVTITNVGTIDLLLQNIQSGGGPIAVTQEAGNLVLGTLNAGTGAVTLTSAGSILDANGPALNVTAGAGSSFTAAGGVVGTVADPLEISVIGAAPSIFAASQSAGVSANLSGTVAPSDTLNVVVAPVPPGQVIWNGRVIFPIAPVVPPAVPFLTATAQVISDLSALFAFLYEIEGRRRTPGITG